MTNPVAQKTRAWGGNPKTSKWFAPSQEKRTRKRYTVTLEPATIAIIEQISARTGIAKSQVVEEAVLALLASKKKPKK